MQKALITLVSLFLILITLIFFFGFTKVERPALDSLDQTSYIPFGEPNSFVQNTVPFINAGDYYCSYVVYRLQTFDEHNNIIINNYAVFLVSVPIPNVSFDEFILMPSYNDLELNIDYVYAPFVDTLNPTFEPNFLEPFIDLDYIGSIEFDRYTYNEEGKIKLIFSDDFYLRMSLDINNIINPLNMISAYLSESRPKIFESELFDFTFDSEDGLLSIFNPIKGIFNMIWSLFWEYPNWILKHITLYFGYFGGIFIW